MMGDVRMSECYCFGEIFVYDLAEMRIGHLTKLTPTLIKKCHVVATVRIYLKKKTLPDPTTKFILMSSICFFHSYFSKLRTTVNKI